MQTSPLSAHFPVRHPLLRLVLQPRLAILLVAVVVAATATRSSAADKQLEYNLDVRPILADKCFACHGPDSAARKADLRLDQREAAVEMGAIAPGEPDESELIRRIRSDDEFEVMPPPETKKSLTNAERETLARWIRDGAEYQLHWSFIPPQRPAIPDAAALADGRFAAWPRNPIDAFVLRRMLAEGLEPAPEADRRTLARRVSLDLTGLPPQPELVAAFIEDESPAAYEKLVDTLLESQHWGEHRGRYWLDYARYADTHGIHFDNYREMWTYREWVIDAFNSNMPFDQFTIENLAGDLLPDPTLDQLIGSGFNRCNMTTNEGGIIDEEYLVLYTRDRTETTSQVWLGMTAGCAVCHSHKFDPLTQHEFYELAAFFNNTTQRARDGNVKDTPPIIAVPLEQDRERWNALPELIAGTQQQIDQRRQKARPEFEAWLVELEPDELRAGLADADLHLRAELNEGQQTVAEGQPQTIRIDVAGEPRDVPLTSTASWRDGPAGKAALQLSGAACELPDVGDFAADQPFSCAAWVHVPANDGNGAICARMDNASAYRGWDFWMQRRQVGTHIIHAWPDQGLKVVAKNQVPANQWVHVTVTYDGSGKAAGVKVYYDGKPQQTNVESDKLAGPIDTDVAFKIGQRSSEQPFQGGLHDLRLYRRELPPADVRRLARLSRISDIAAKPTADRTAAETKEVYEFWLGEYDVPFRTLTRELASLERERNDIQARGTIAHVMNEDDDPAMAYVLFRGEYDQRRDEVRPDTPAVFPAFPNELPRDRLGFAQWLLLDDHPLTARVTVNRFWQEVFGNGIVKTAGDFGVAGQLPTHPELLDWLAVEFRESGWDVKRLFKLIVMSATYRQSAEMTPQKVELDPENRLLSHGPRFRMDAEMVRDYALAASGLLVREIGGPSVKPYQPDGVWEAIAMNVSNTRSYVRDTGKDLYRRSLYTFVKRMAPPASMEIFNAPNRELCTVQRERTNTPLQALVTLNDEQFVEAARHLAARSIREGGDTFDGRIRVLALRLLAREFRPDEVRVIRQSLDHLASFYHEHSDEAAKLIAVGESPADDSIDPHELAAWTMLANQLMNLDEVLNK